MTDLSDKPIKRLQEIVDLSELTDPSGRYEILERLGSGGMGSVFRARDRHLHRFIALKVLSTTLEDNPDLRKRMVREAEIIASLEHPNIVPIHDVGTFEDTRPFYVMKFVQGETLEAHWNDRIATSDLLSIFLKICESIDFAHSRGVIHRDLKPANIMVGPFGEVLVMDWGIAKSTASGMQQMDQNHEMVENGVGISLTETGNRVGTIGYMAPEQHSESTSGISFATDIYSLSGILYFLLTGSHPVRKEHGTGENSGNSPQITSPHLIQKEVSRRIAAICNKGLAENPNDRYQSVKELVADVRRFQEHQPVTAYRDTFFEKLWRWIDRNRVIVIIILVYMLVRFFILFFIKI